MFSLFLRPEDTSPSTSCLTPHMKHNHATLQTLHQQEPCRQEQHSLFKTKLISSIVSNHLYKCPDAYKSQTLIRAFSLVPHIGSYKHTCTAPPAAFLLSAVNNRLDQQTSDSSLSTVINRHQGQAIRDPFTLQVLQVVTCLTHVMLYDIVML